MNNPKKTWSYSRLILMLAIASSLAVAYGCGKRSDGEKAGEKVDDALHEAKNGPKDLFDKDGKAENAGEAVDRAIDGDE